MRPPPALTLATPAALLLLFLLAGPGASASGAAATTTTPTTTCGTTIGGPCCPPPGPSNSPDGQSLWSCTAAAATAADGGTPVPLVCLDESDAGVTACLPLPDASPRAACGRNGQRCCPPNYHRHTSAVLPASCADGFCENMAGAVPCSNAKPLEPCGLCTANLPGCGAAVGAPCCVYSTNGPSDTLTCGSQTAEDLTSGRGLVPGVAGLTCDFVTRACVQAP
jgi:hypothetical protein